DAPDHRLIRSGVLLAHRVLDGRGEWYLGAPDWVPLLPQERIDPMSHGDLPEELADLVRPFRRRAPLGPVAALRCERREFALRDDRGTTMALLRDDKVTVRRGGLTTARYREVMMTPVGPGLTAKQDAWLGSCLRSAGATTVPKFPRLVTRLGAPSTGPTDFPAPQPLDGDGPFGHFVSSLLAARLRELLQADLGVRAGRPEASATLAGAARLLRAQLEGLSSVLEPGWVEDLDEELGWLIDTAAAEAPGGRPGDEPAEADLRARLRGERYLTLLERLVTAARAPAGGDSSALRTEDVLQALLDAALQRLTRSAGRLAADSPAEDWQAARFALDEVVQVCALYAMVAGDRFTRLQGRLAAVADLFDEAASASQTAAQTRAGVAEVTPAEAFELGLRYAAEQQVAHAAREEFVRHWSRAAKKLTA
ncbi:MAG: hypothetical protein ACLGIF_09430, partial [Actinomycetes bacterium]